jgi:hypothetical protein
VGADILFVQPYKGEPVSVVEVSFELVENGCCCACCLRALCCWLQVGGDGDTNVSLFLLLVSSLTFKTPTIVSACYLLKVHLHLSKIKSHNEVTKQYDSRFFLLFLLTEPGPGGPKTYGSGSPTLFLALKPS